MQKIWEDPKNTLAALFYQAKTYANQRMFPGARHSVWRPDKLSVSQYNPTHVSTNRDLVHTPE